MAVAISVAIVLADRLLTLVTSEISAAVALSLNAITMSTAHCLAITPKPTTNCIATTTPPADVTLAPCRFYIANTMSGTRAGAYLVSTRTACVTVAAETGAIHAHTFEVAVLRTRRNGAVTTAKAVLAHAQVGGGVALSIKRTIIWARS